MAYQFNGSTQYLSVAQAIVTSPPISMSAWINLNSVSTGNVISIDNPADYTAYRIQIASGYLRAAVTTSNSDPFIYAQSTSTVSTGAWLHVAAVYSSSASRTIYFANQKATNTDSISISNVTRTVIGATSGFNYVISQLITGTIAEPAIWNVALTDAEIASLAAGFTPDQIRPQSLQFYAPLVRNLIDVRGGRTITNVGSATVATHPRIYS